MTDYLLNDRAKARFVHPDTLPVQFAFVIFACVATW
jgi:hypothetical protein